MARNRPASCLERLFGRVLTKVAKNKRKMPEVAGWLWVESYLGRFSALYSNFKNGAARELFGFNSLDGLARELINNATDARLVDNDSGEFPT